MNFNTKFPEKYKYYNIDLNNPAIDLRADLKAIPSAINHGFDVVEGETFADIVVFKKENITVWGVIDVIRAEEITGAYKHHQHFSSYAEAFAV